MFDTDFLVVINPVINGLFECLQFIYSEHKDIEQSIQISTYLIHLIQVQNDINKKIESSDKDKGDISQIQIEGIERTNHQARLPMSTNQGTRKINRSSKH